MPLHPAPFVAQSPNRSKIVHTPASSTRPEPDAASSTSEELVPASKDKDAAGETESEAASPSPTKGKNSLDPLSWTTWIMSDTELDAAVAPEDASDLVCEECEKRQAIVVCEAESEVLCPRCCKLLYPRSSTGAQHSFYTQYKIRLVRTGDSSGAVLSSASNNIPSHAMTEDHWQELGRDLNVPRALEAPPKNILHATTRSNLSGPKYLHGEVVVFSVEDALPDQLQQGAALPLWRNREIWGRVVGEAHRTHGQYGHAVRRGDAHEPQYRVKCEHWVLVDPCHDYSFETAQAIEVHEERSALDRRVEGIKIKGGRIAPFAEEKHQAWVRDKKIKQLKESRGFAGHEDADGAQSDDKQFPTIVVLPESSLLTPMECRQALVRRREQACHVTLQIVDDWLYECRLEWGFAYWFEHFQHSIAMERDNAAMVIQRLARAQAGKALMRAVKLAKEREEWKEKRKHLSKFKFLITEEEKANGYTTDGKVYFATLHECEVYTRLWQQMALRVKMGVLKEIQNLQSQAWERWTKYVEELIRLERMPSNHLREVEEDIVKERNQPKETTAAASGGRPWHPAVNLTRLPPLPRMWSYRDPSGQVVIEHPNKFNSYRALMTGPTESSHWVVPGIVLVGGYPEGKAKRKGRQPSHPSSIGQILVSGVATFVCLMTPEEVQNFERLHDLPGHEKFIRKEHERIRGGLAGSVVKMETNLHLAKSEVRGIPVFKKNDMRYEEANKRMQQAIAKERLAFANVERAKLDLARLPPAPDILHFPIEDGGVPRAEDLRELLGRLEDKIREGTGIYVFSRCGHGRAVTVGACLLGKLYGCPLMEVLERAQSYHDSQGSVLSCGRQISAPQTVQQVQLVAEILADNDSIYATIKSKASKPTTRHTTVVTFPQLRGRGMPLPLPPKYERIDDDEQQEPETFHLSDYDHDAEAQPGKPSSSTLPPIPCPTKPSMRSVRPQTILEEEYEKTRIVHRLRELDLTSKDSGGFGRPSSLD